MVEGVFSDMAVRRGGEVALGGSMAGGLVAINATGTQGCCAGTLNAPLGLGGSYVSSSWPRTVLLSEGRREGAFPDRSERAPRKVGREVSPG